MKRSNLLIGYFALLFSTIQAQETPNLVDSLGQKQGMWKEFKIPYVELTTSFLLKNENIGKEYLNLSKKEDRKGMPIYECIGEYRNNLKTGIWMEYYMNGVLKSKIEYRDGIPFGKGEIFWENGNKKVEFTIGDIPNFLIKIYNPDGSLMLEEIGSKDIAIKSIYQN